MTLLKTIDNAESVVDLLDGRNLCHSVMCNLYSLQDICRNLEAKELVDEIELVNDTIREIQRKLRNSMPQEYIEGVEEEKRRRKVDV